MKKLHSMLAALLVVSVTAPAAAQQPRASQRGTVSQTIHTTNITITYDRPVARGRVLFGDGGIVVYDALWTPGANRATILEVSGDVRIADKPVPAGKYSVWTIPRADQWTFILNRVWDTQHAIYPGDDDDMLRIAVVPVAGAHMETLAYYFPVVGPYNAVLHIHWGELVLPIPIDVGR